MGAALDVTTIQNEARYWYARLAFMATQSIASKGQASLFNLASWNDSQDLTVQARVRSLGATQDPNLWMTLQADQNPITIYGDMMRPALRPVETDAMAVSNVSLAATNSGTAATVNSRFLYGVDVWQLPLADRIMRGIPVSAGDKSLAAAVGLDLDPNSQQGTYPIPIGAVIERTYENRQVASPIVYAGRSPTASTADNSFLTITTSSANEILVLRRLGARAPDGPDYNVRLRVDQDSNSQILDLDASMMSLDEPLDLILPARRQLTFHVIALTAAPPGPIPVRIEVWRLSLDTILRVRLGLQGLGAVTQVMIANVLAALPSTATAADKAAATAKARQSAAALFTRIMAGVK